MIKHILTYIIGISLMMPAAILAQSDIKAIKENVRFLSSDSLKGREPGTPGGYQAANFIAQHFGKIGLKPFAQGKEADNPYFRNFKFSINTKTNEHSQVSIKSANDGKVINTLKIGDNHWQVMPQSSNIKTDSLSIVFAGFGVTSTDINYDDYASIDAAGKAVIVLSDSSIKGIEEYNFLSDYSSLYYKIHNAKSHDAKMLILVKRNNQEADAMYKNSFDRLASSEIPVIQISRSEAKRLFPELKDLDKIEIGINHSKQANSFPIKESYIAANIEQNMEYKDVPNVVGYIAGKNPALKDEYIVVGGHFDHLGMGQFNSLYTGSTPMVHNGADDNASGTSAVMELARIFAEKPSERPMIFVAFNCEESGLYGSSNFVKNPPIPTKNIVTMINFDMIGRLVDNKLTVIGTGTSNTNEKILDSLMKQTKFELSKVQDGFAPSDQTSFFAEKIPVLMFFTGVHKDYHTPYDDIEKINFDGMVNVINTAEKVIRSIADLPTKPDFIDKPVTANKDQKPVTMGKSGVWFGIVPNFADNPDGMPISGASEGSPAEEIGLQNGDVITEFAGKKLKNLYDLTYTLRELKPGDVVKVKYIRDGKTIEVDCTLRRRKK